MLAESIHSVADSANQALLLLGMRRARREPTPAHPFGYGRERYFWSFIVAVVLFTLGGVFSIYEGLEKLRHPHEIESFGWAIGVLGVAIVLESFSFRTAIHEANATSAGRHAGLVGVHPALEGPGAARSSCSRTSARSSVSSSRSPASTLAAITRRAALRRAREPRDRRPALRDRDHRSRSSCAACSSASRRRREDLEAIEDAVRVGRRRRGSAPRPHAAHRAGRAPRRRQGEAARRPDARQAHRGDQPRSRSASAQRVPAARAIYIEPDVAGRPSGRSEPERRADGAPTSASTPTRWRTRSPKSSSSAEIAWSYKQASFITRALFAGEWGTRLFVDAERLDEARRSPSACGAMEPDDRDD